MSHASKKVKEWRRRTKERIIESLGGKCAICGYNKCSNVFDIHHLNPKDKEFSLASIRANPKSWNSIVEELRKCVLLCANCHREVHADFSLVPDDAPRFNEKFAKYKKFGPTLKDEYCRYCNKQLTVEQRFYCSNKCSASSRSSIDWSQFDLEKMYNSMPVTKIANIIGCSDPTVHKKLRKMGLK